MKFKKSIVITTYIILLALIIGACSSGSIDTANDIENEKLKVHYIDVGQGDSTFIQLPNGETMLIDGGTRGAGSDLIEYLDKQNVKKIDYIIATHPHEDHIGGLVEVINKYTVGKIYMPEVTHTTKVFENLLLAIQNKDKKISKAVAGEVILDKDRLNIKIIAPEKGFDDSNLNNYSVVIKLDYINNSFLFTGDAEVKSENIILDRGYDIRADVLKLGHHGSDTSTTPDFLDKVKPKYGVISAGKDNKYGHPNKSTIDNLVTRNIEIYRTDLEGTIIAISDGKRISFNEKEDSDIDEEYLVYRTNTGDKYHLSDCRTLKDSKVSISLNEAIKQGYTPCKICNPPSGVK